MKKLLLLICILPYSLFSFTQSNSNPESVQRILEFDAQYFANNSNQASIRNPFELDSAYHFLLPEIKLNIREYYTNNSDGLKLTAHREVLNLSTNEWKNFSFIEISRDGNGRILTLKYSKWIDNSSSFELDYELTFDYDSDGNRIKETRKDWDATQMALFNFYQISDSFNVDNQIVETHRQNWNIITNEWVEFTKTTYTYNLDGTFAGKLVENWIPQLQFYVNSLQHIYNHELDFQIIDTIRIWDITYFAWDNYLIDQDYYNPSGSIASKYDYVWNENLASPSWVFEDYIGFSYDGNGKLSEELHQDYDFSSGTWEDKLKWVYFYSELDPSSTSIVKENLIDCFFQNPIRNGETISCPLQNINEQSQLTIFDISGKLLLEKTISGNVEFEMPWEMKSGTYFLNIHQGKNLVFREKIILVK